MKHQIFFILFAAVLVFSACTKKTPAPDPIAAAPTPSADAPAQNSEPIQDVKDFKATSVDPNDPSNRDDSTTVKSGGTSAAH